MLGRKRYANGAVSSRRHTRSAVVGLSEIRVIGSGDMNAVNGQRLRAVVGQGDLLRRAD